MKNKKIKILGLDQYNLDYKKLAGMGDLELDVYAPIRYWPEKKFFKYPPKTRKKKRGQWYRNAYREITDKWPSKKIEKKGSHRRPYGFTSTIKAKDIQALHGIEYLDEISILKIQGMKKEKKEPGNEMTYFSVKARFAEQVEARTKGLQRYEERIILVKAYDFQDAEHKAIKSFRDYEHTYLAADGMEMVRWIFEEIIDTYDVSEKEIDPKGTEVYSTFKFRRLKPETEWHPEYESEKDEEK